MGDKSAWMAQLAPIYDRMVEIRTREKIGWLDWLLDPRSNRRYWYPSSRRGAQPILTSKQKEAKKAEMRAKLAAQEKHFAQLSLPGHFKRKKRR